MTCLIDANKQCVLSKEKKNLEKKREGKSDDADKKRSI